MEGKLLRVPEIQKILCMHLLSSLQPSTSLIGLALGRQREDLQSKWIFKKDFSLMKLDLKQ